MAWTAKSPIPGNHWVPFGSSTLLGSKMNLLICVFMYHFSNLLKDPDAPKVNNPAADGDNSTAVQIVENNTGDGDNAANDKSKDAEGAKDAEEGKFIWHFSTFWATFSKAS